MQKNTEKTSREKPWTIHSWEDLRNALSVMKERGKLFNIIKTEMIKRDHWKNAKRGMWAPKKPLDP